ncbi:Ubiquinone biosynthesis protein coq9, mitochondrial [Savitreella phatthalungensis]
MISGRKAMFRVLRSPHGSLASFSRPFHSADSPKDIAADPILDAALKHVSEHGFTLESIKRGAQDAGYLDASHALYPDGAFALVTRHLDLARQSLHHHAEAAFADEKSIGKRIRMLCELRLRANEPYIDRLQDAFAVMALPSNVRASMHALHELSDTMWHLAGDDAADMNWYSKRLSLSGVYAASELFMTQDRSQDFNETMAFLDRRLRDVSTLGRSWTEISTFVGFQLWQARNIAASKGLKF